jgi:hypothetical protein
MEQSLVERPARQRAPRWSWRVTHLTVTLRDGTPSTAGPGVPGDDRGWLIGVATGPWAAGMFTATRVGRAALGVAAVVAAGSAARMVARRASLTRCHSRWLGGIA